VHQDGTTNTSPGDRSNDSPPSTTVPDPSSTALTRVPVCRSQLVVVPGSTRRISQRIVGMTSRPRPGSRNRMVASGESSASSRASNAASVFCQR
jgi:hypothetical protein